MIAHWIGSSQPAETTTSGFLPVSFANLYSAKASSRAVAILPGFRRRENQRRSRPNLQPLRWMTTFVESKKGLRGWDLSVVIHRCFSAGMFLPQRGFLCSIWPRVRIYINSNKFLVFEISLQTMSQGVARSGRTSQQVLWHLYIASSATDCHGKQKWTWLPM